MPNIIASKTISGDIYIFDSDFKSKGSRRLSDYQIWLKGHYREGYGLSWNLQRPGLLVSGSDDGLVWVWDIDSKEILSK